MPVKGYDAEAFEWRGINADGTPDEAMLERLRTAIVDAVEPERIILFGSAARGDMRAKSDLDVLVVKDGGNRRRVRRRIYRRLPRGLRRVDLIVASKDEVEAHKDTPWFPIEPARREGRVLYDRTAQA